MFLSCDCELPRIRNGENFRHLIEQVPKDAYSDVKALISEKVAIFRPKSFIINKKMCSEDYNFILPSSTLPPAKIGDYEYRLNKESLIAISSEVEYLCTHYVPTREYINIVVNKNFFEEIALEVTGKRRIDFSNIEYARSRQLLRIITDLENELIYNKNNCPLMIQSITTQLIIQLLRDSGNYTSTSGIETDNSINLVHPSESCALINPIYFSMLSFANKLLPNSKLTPREIEIGAYLFDRLDYDEIASKLFISKNTLKTHVKNIYKKLDVSGRKEMNIKVSGMYYRPTI